MRFLSIATSVRGVAITGIVQRADAPHKRWVLNSISYYACHYCGGWIIYHTRSIRATHCPRCGHDRCYCYICGFTFEALAS